MRLRYSYITKGCYDAATPLSALSLLGNYIPIMHIPQANQFLLSMQFSYSPWQYDDEVSDVFHRIMKKREELMDFLVDACRKSCADAEPVIRCVFVLSYKLNSFGPESKPRSKQAFPKLEAPISEWKFNKSLLYLF